MAAKNKKAEAGPAAVTLLGFRRYPVICPAGHQFTGETFAVAGLEGTWCADDAQAAARGGEPAVPSFGERLGAGNSGGFENRTATAGHITDNGGRFQSPGFESRIVQHDIR